ncbi:BMP family ABC transporter substrate-binding protein [Oscillospiraceae bacterium HV4-5-C5C]|nr:BMP family ABC transporter substrate-binding protein [Oscillospiraceae bacterium HV4-5-C5C]
MKKQLTVLLSGLLLLSSLAACQSGSSPSATTTTATATTAEAEQATTADSAAATTAAAESSQTAAASEEEIDASTLKVAAIFGGAINDGNWNETQYNGLKQIEEEGASIAYLENVGDTDAAQAARDYASSGYQLIYLTTNSYQDYCLPVAADFPDTTFVSINGTVNQDNYISVRIADEQQGFMMGLIAALLSESGKVGFVGGLEINPIKLGSSGFQQGVDYANQNYGLSVEAKRINTGSFTDVNQAKETAISLIEDGCDVVTPMANDAGVGVMEAAEEKGATAIASGIGQETSAPTATAVTVVKDVAVAYTETFKAYRNHTLSGSSTVETFGANKGVVYLTDWLTDASQEVKDRVTEVMDQLANGEIDIDLTI